MHASSRHTENCHSEHDEKDKTRYTRTDTDTGHNMLQTITTAVVSEEPQYGDSGTDSNHRDGIVLWGQVASPTKSDRTKIVEERCSGEILYWRKRE
jgi:hypothetical protein